MCLMRRNLQYGCGGTTFVSVDRPFFFFLRRMHVYLLSTQRTLGRAPLLRDVHPLPSLPVVLSVSLAGCIKSYVRREQLAHFVVLRAGEIVRRKIS